MQIKLLLINTMVVVFAVNCADSALASEGGHNKFKIGGQARLRGDFIENQGLGDFSFNPDTRDEQALSRTRLSLSVEPVEWIEGFIQGQFYDRQNHSDYSQANLYQGYLELFHTGLPVGLKIGRQEFSYGSAFFLGANDFYEGLAWDGAKLNVSARDDFRIDIIAARYVKLDKNTSDDEPALYGAYSSYELTHDTSADLYFFYHKGGFRFFHSDLPDNDKWFTLGTRISGKIKGGFDYEIEPLYQFGRIDNPDRSGRDTISAYGGHIESGYTFRSKYNPRLFFGYAFGTGDNNASDKKYREFHGNVYNDNYLVGDTGVIPDLSGVTTGDFRASGMRVFVCGLSADVHPKLNLNLDYHYFTAGKTPAGISKRMGSEANLIAAYKLMENVDIIAGANRFFTGKFFKDAAGSGRDINYFYIQAQVEF